MNKVVVEPGYLTRLNFRVGARTLLSIPRRLVRISVALDEALGAQGPALPALPERADGYFIGGLPADALPTLQSRTPGLRTFIRQRHARHYADLRIGYPAYFESFSPKRRSTLKRKVRKLADRCGGSLDIRCYRSPEEMADFHKLARSVSAKTYQERLLDAGMPDGAGVLAAMQALAHQDAVRGWILFVDGAPVAYLYAPAEGDSLLYLYLGYDPEFAAWSPGTVLQLEAMRDMMADRFRWFDFTGGDGEHKRQFATGTLDCVDVLLLRPTIAIIALGHALCAFDVSIAAAKRALLTLRGDALVRGLRR